MIRTLLLFVALLTGGGAFWLLLQSPPAATQDSPEIAGIISTDESLDAVAELERVQVLAVNRAVAEGTALSVNDFEWIEWPRDYLPTASIIIEDAPGAPSELRGLISRISLSPNEPLQRTMFAEPLKVATGSEGIKQLLDPGMRAVPVRIQMDISTIALFEVGDRVDVIHTEFTSDRNIPSSRIIASNIRVLNINAPEINSEQAAAQTTLTAVLEVSVDEASAVTAASQVGALSLLQRSMQDDPTPGPVLAALAEQLAPRMRAMNLPDVEQGTNQKLRLNDRVDILFIPDELFAEKFVSGIIVSNARILALPASSGLSPASMQTHSALGSGDRGITIEVDQLGVEALSRALAFGKLSIILRPADDGDTEVTSSPLPVTAPTVRVRRAGEL